MPPKRAVKVMSSWVTPILWISVLASSHARISHLIYSSLSTSVRMSWTLTASDSMIDIKVLELNFSRISPIPIALFVISAEFLIFQLHTFNVPHGSGKVHLIETCVLLPCLYLYVSTASHLICECGLCI